jgi:hypothetical protein
VCVCDVCVIYLVVMDEPPLFLVYCGGGDLGCVDGVMMSHLWASIGQTSLVPALYL